MKIILLIIPVVSVIFGIINGRMSEVSAAVLNKAGEAVTLAISICGVMCLWSGLMKVAEQAGIMRFISRLLSPIVCFLFRGLKKGGRAVQLISMNLSANLLGLGNASTPLGISAMEAIRQEEQGSDPIDEASDNMVMLTVLNTASLQIVPATAAALRSAHGVKQPMDILPCVWITSVYAAAVAVISAKLLAKRSRSVRKRGISND